MRLEVNRGDLLGVLQKVQSVISTRRFPPFSSGVLMKAKEEKTCLQAFDSESYFKGYTDARIEGEGTFIVDTRKLYDIVKALPADTVSIEDKKDRIRITAGKSRFNSYLIDAFEAMDEGRVRLNIRDESSPIMLEPEDSNGYLCMIMPVRV